CASNDASGRTTARARALTLWAATRTCGTVELAAGFRVKRTNHAGEEPRCTGAAGDAVHGVLPSLGHAPLQSYRRALPANQPPLPTGQNGPVPLRLHDGPLRPGLRLQLQGRVRVPGSEGKAGAGRELPRSAASSSEPLSATAAAAVLQPAAGPSAAAASSAAQPATAEPPGALPSIC
ncbi:unnamed protein product, partial [Ixodes hexagonus]